MQGGRGQLREEVRKVLQFYGGDAFHDADARRYGNGATEGVFCLRPSDRTSAFSLPAFIVP